MSIGSAPQFCAECRCFRVWGSHGDPFSRWDSPMGDIHLPSLSAGCHPWKGPFYPPQKTPKMGSKPISWLSSLAGAFLSSQKSPNMYLAPSVYLPPSMYLPPSTYYHRLCTTTVYVPGGSQSRFFDRCLQRNWGSGIHPRIPRKLVRSCSSDPPFHAQGSQDDVSSQANSLKPWYTIACHGMP